MSVSNRRAAALATSTATAIDNSPIRRALKKLLEVKIGPAYYPVFALRALRGSVVSFELQNVAYCKIPCERDC